jgi:hypothetical protein
MNIRCAITDEELLACYPVLRELRPHLEESRFVERIRNQEKDGYRLAYVANEEGVVAVAGYRIGQNLAWGRFLYVDDLVANANQKDMGQHCCRGSGRLDETRVVLSSTWIQGSREKMRTASTPGRG